MPKEFDYSFKVVVIGSSFTGKSSLIIKFADDMFIEKYQSTIGIDFKFKSLKVDDHVCRIQLWDTAGQEKFKTLTTSYYKGAHAVVMVCDQGSRKSFEDIKKHWLPEVKDNADYDVEKVLLLNKMDLPQKDLDAIEVQEFANKEGIMVYETSAKTGKNVTGVFTELCRKLIVKESEVNRKRNRNVATDKSLFKSSAYDQSGDVRLNAGNTGQQQGGEQAGGMASCCK